MKIIKNTLLVSSLSLGLIVGTVGIISAATSTDFQEKVAASLKPDTMAVEMNADSQTAVTHTGANGNSAAMEMNVGQNIHSQPLDTNIQQLAPQQLESSQSAPQQPTPQKPSSPKPSLQNVLQLQQNVLIPVNVNTNGYFKNTLGGSQISGQWSLNMGM
ncbi:hypothetical protein [Desulfosporosinus sp. BICA1-9]|uniref:hypothetical protein n=1 Tax=Desulfosporosinus sp. BICA1-9 TaxID=1531958 RepID=UPI000A5B4A07|nr:hypothetical protein [Desulfosporosinus sp. BICA1-9]HBW35012.1 hypothetical protein [Desulfosporosinus sp.]